MAAFDADVFVWGTLCSMAAFDADDFVWGTL